MSRSRRSKTPIVHTIARRNLARGIDRAAREPARSEPRSRPAVGCRRLARLHCSPAAERRGLPLLVASVASSGRRACRSCSRRRAATTTSAMLNLVRRRRPRAASAGETLVLGQTGRCLRTRPRTRGLVLLGHRANRDVATMLRIARVRLGRPHRPARRLRLRRARRRSSASRFLEAMATGLVVVAPNAGGPATYLHEGSPRPWQTPRPVADETEALRRAAAARADERAPAASTSFAPATPSRQWQPHLRLLHAHHARVRAGRCLIVTRSSSRLRVTWYPLSAIAGAVRLRGIRVVVAQAECLLLLSPPPGTSMSSSPSGRAATRAFGRRARRRRSKRFSRRPVRE